MMKIHFGNDFAVGRSIWQWIVLGDFKHLVILAYLIKAFSIAFVNFHESEPFTKSSNYSTQLICTPDYLRYILSKCND